jgi:hypothetical protein
MMRQGSNLLVLSVLVSTSTAIAPQVPAGGLSHPAEPPSTQRTSSTTYSKDNFRPRLSRSKRQARLPRWESDPLVASLDPNLYHEKSAQFLTTQHTPPAAYLPSQSQSEAIGETDDDEHTPRPADPNDRPVPTKWLMLGYSRVADIPTSLPTGTGYHLESSSSGPTVANYPAHQKPSGTQRDWMQGFNAQFMGVLTLFLILVLVMEGFGYLWRTSWRRKAVDGGRGELALCGDEKQLRAFGGDDELRSEAASTKINFRG